MNIYTNTKKIKLKKKKTVFRVSNFPLSLTQNRNDPTRLRGARFTPFSRSSRGGGLEPPPAPLSDTP